MIYKLETKKCPHEDFGSCHLILPSLWGLLFSAILFVVIIVVIIFIIKIIP